MDRTRLTALTLSVLLLAGCAQASPAPTENGSFQTAGTIAPPGAPACSKVSRSRSPLLAYLPARPPDPVCP